MFTTKNADLCFIVTLMLVDQSDTTVIYEALAGNTHLPVIILVKRTANVYLFIRPACHFSSLISSIDSYFQFIAIILLPLSNDAIAAIHALAVVAKQIVAIFPICRLHNCFQIRYVD